MEDLTQQTQMAIITSSSFVFHGLLLFFFSLLFHSCSLDKRYAYAGGQGTMKSDRHVVDFKSLQTNTVCSDSFSKGPRKSPAMLRLAHRDGPCAPQGHRGNATTAYNPTQILLQDKTRVRYLNSKFSKKAEDIGEQDIPVGSGLPLETGNFIVTIGFGTPKEDLTLVFDTGSDLTWIQCLPCAGECHPQVDPIFNPSKSSSYSNISCNSTECSKLASSSSAGTSCYSSTCLYIVEYGDQSYTIGFFAHETLTLTSSDIFPNFQFGCGQENKGLFGMTAGLLGLGRGKVSLVSQTSQKFGGIFSYCLPPTTSSTGYLAFGANSNAGVKYTPLLANSRSPSFYFVKMLGISVDGQTLSISPSTFSSPGTILDSGTVITRLPSSAYAALRTAFRKSMSKYPSAQPVPLLDTCYDLSAYDTFTTPKIVLHFDGGVDVDLDQSGIVYVVSKSQVCLGFAGNKDPRQLTIIGNTQQRTFEVIYNVNAGKIGFRPGACTKS